MPLSFVSTGVFTPLDLQRGSVHYSRAQICVSILNNHPFCLSSCLLASLWNAMLHNSTKTQRKKNKLQKIKSLIIKHLKCWTDIRKYATLYILMRIKSYMVSTLKQWNEYYCAFIPCINYCSCMEAETVVMVSFSWLVIKMINSFMTFICLNWVGYKGSAKCILSQLNTFIPENFPSATDALSNVTDYRNLYSGQPLSKLPESLQGLVSLTHD